MDVPLKNLRRWVENGPKRKKGGRKTHDPEMEMKLYTWVKQYKDVFEELPSRKKIKETAMEYSQYPDKFKASKGWYEKFMLRHFSTKKIDDETEKSWNERWLSNKHLINGISICEPTKEKDLIGKRSKEIFEEQSNNQCVEVQTEKDLMVEEFKMKKRKEVPLTNKNEFFEICEDFVDQYVNKENKKLNENFLDKIQNFIKEKNQKLNEISSKENEINNKIEKSNENDIEKSFSPSLSQIRETKNIFSTLKENPSNPFTAGKNENLSLESAFMKNYFGIKSQKNNFPSMLSVKPNENFPFQNSDSKINNKSVNEDQHQLDIPHRITNLTIYNEANFTEKTKKLTSPCNPFENEIILGDMNWEERSNQISSEMRLDSVENLPPNKYILI